MFLKDILGTKKHLILGILICVIVILAVMNNFIQDDAFISFRYARNLVEHNTFSWNESDLVKIEGYTNFLWTVMIALAMKVDIDPVLASKVLGISFGVGTLLVTYAICKLILKDSRYSLLSVFLLGTNYTFSAYMTGGLETQLQTFLITCVCLFTFKSINKDRSNKTHLFLIGIFSGLAVLTRLDSCLLIGIFAAYLLIINYKKPGYSIQLLVEETFIIALPILVLVVPWLIWKYSYYGNLLPNSFYLKGTVGILSISVIKSSLGYVFSFLGSYHLFPFILILVIHHKRIVTHPLLLSFAIAIFFWVVYIIKVGGDFMEFRFFVPLLPFIIILVTWCISIVGKQWIKYTFVVTVVLGSISHQFLFTNFRGIVSVETLRNEVVGEKYSWSEVGIKLNQLFKLNDVNATIATTAAGAIPYYSQLNTVDMLGLNDLWIARNGESITEYFRPGHNKWAKLDYYLKENVNLIIGHPEIRRKGWADRKNALSIEEFKNFQIASLNLDELPPKTTIVEIPLNSNFNFYVLYIKSDPGIDKIIREEDLKKFSISEMNFSSEVSLLDL